MTFTNKTGKELEVVGLVAVIDNTPNGSLKGNVILRPGEAGEGRITGGNCATLAKSYITVRDYPLFDKTRQNADGFGYLYSFETLPGSSGYTITPADVSAEHILKPKGS